MIGIIFNTETLRDTPLREKKGNILFVAIDDDLLEQLEESKDKKKFISSEKFLKGIKYKYCTIYDEKKKVIPIDGCDPKYISLLLDTIARFFEESVTVAASYTDFLARKGFSNPKICSKYGDVCFSKKNSFFKESSEKSVKAEYDFVVSQIDKDYCELNIKLTGDTKNFLKHIVSSGVTLSGDNRSQKEFFGIFKLIDSSIVKNKIIHTLEVDRSSLISGNEDNIKANASLYNFHSHPFAAYQKYRVNYAPPSVQDYRSIFLMAKEYNTIVHFVAGIEGLYVVYVNPEKYYIDPDEIINKLEYDDVETVKELESYIKHVNSYDLFNVKLFKWDSKGDIVVKFGKSGKYGHCKIR